MANKPYTITKGGLRMYYEQTNGNVLLATAEGDVKHDQKWNVFINSNSSAHKDEFTIQHEESGFYLFATNGTNVSCSSGSDGEDKVWILHLGGRTTVINKKYEEYLDNIRETVNLSSDKNAVWAFALQE